MIHRGREPQETPTTDRDFYARWVLANGTAEAVGLGTTFLLGGALAPMLARTQTLFEVMGAALLAVVLGTLLEGVVVGYAQGSVLRRRIPLVRLRSWVGATAVGAGAAWLVGMVPSSIAALLAEPTTPSAVVEEPGLLLQLLLAAGLGLVTGPILGIAQWWVLRRHFDEAVVWLGANALAWGVGMPVIFWAMDRVPGTEARGLARRPSSSCV